MSNPPRTARRLPRRGGVLAAVVLLLVAGQLVARRLGIEWSPASVRDTVLDLGVWGPVLFVSLVSLRQVILVPSQVLLVAGGLCFGALAGALYGALGLTVSGTMIFAMTRYIGKDAIWSQIPENLRPVVESAGRRAGPLLVAVGTGYPVGPLSAYHAGAALTGMSLLAFVLALVVGALVRGLIFSYFGSALLDDAGKSLLVGGVVMLAAVGLPLLFPRVRGWLLQAPPDSDDPT